MEDPGTQHQWRIPDFAVLTSPHPMQTTILVGDLLNPPADILVSLLPENTAIIPAIIEIKTQASNDIISVMTTLTTTQAQLEGQVQHFFSNFPWQTKAITIAGVGFYWLWWEILRCDYSPEEAQHLFHHHLMMVAEDQGPREPAQLHCHSSWAQEPQITKYPISAMWFIRC